MTDEERLAAEQRARVLIDRQLTDGIPARRIAD